MTPDVRVRPLQVLGESFDCSDALEGSATGGRGLTAPLPAAVTAVPTSLLAGGARSGARDRLAVRNAVHRADDASTGEVVRGAGAALAASTTPDLLVVGAAPRRLCAL